MVPSSLNGKVVLNSFPSNRIDALTILYMQSQDLSGKTPEEIANMYKDTWDTISKEFSAIQDREKAGRRNQGHNASLF